MACAATGHWEIGHLISLSMNSAACSMWPMAPGWPRCGQAGHAMCALLPHPALPPWPKPSLASKHKMRSPAPALASTLWKHSSKKIGMPTSIGELGITLSEEQIDELARKCSHDHSRTIGTIRTLNEEDMKAIYRMAR